MVLWFALILIRLECLWICSVFYVVEVYFFQSERRRLVRFFKNENIVINFVQIVSCIGDILRLKLAQLLHSHRLVRIIVEIFLDYVCCICLTSLITVISRSRDKRMTYALLLEWISLAWLHHLLLVKEIVVFRRVLNEGIGRAIVLSECILIVFSEILRCVPHVLTIVNVDNLPFKSYVIARVYSADCTTQTIQVVGRTKASIPLHSFLRWLNTVCDTNEFFLIAVVAFA